MLSVCHVYHVKRNDTCVLIFGLALLGGQYYTMFAIRKNEHSWSMLLDNLECDGAYKIIPCGVIRIPTNGDQQWHTTPSTPIPII